MWPLCSWLDHCICSMFAGLVTVSVTVFGGRNWLSPCCASCHVGDYIACVRRGMSFNRSMARCLLMRSVLCWKKGSAQQVLSCKAAMI